MVDLMNEVLASLNLLDKFLNRHMPILKGSAPNAKEYFLASIIELTATGLAGYFLGPKVAQYLGVVPSSFYLRSILSAYLAMVPAAAVSGYIGRKGFLMW